MFERFFATEFLLKASATPCVAMLERRKANDMLLSTEAATFAISLIVNAFARLGSQETSQNSQSAEFAAFFNKFFATTGVAPSRLSLHECVDPHPSFCSASADALAPCIVLPSVKSQFGSQNFPSTETRAGSNVNWLGHCIGMFKSARETLTRLAGISFSIA